MYNIETALPVIDLEALENHLAAKIAEDQSVSDKGSEIFIPIRKQLWRDFKWDSHSVNPRDKRDLSF